MFLNSRNVRSNDSVLPIGSRHSVWAWIREKWTRITLVETISHWYLFERWCPGAVIGSLFRHHIHLTGLIYSVISIWSIILAIVNQALKPLRYSLQLENPYTSASTPPRVTVHEPDPRFGFGNRQLATSACFIGSWRFYLTSGWGLLMYPAYTRVCLIYYYPFLVKEER